MKRPTRLTRTAVIGVAASLSVVLAACGSSGSGSGGNSAANSGNPPANATSTPPPAGSSSAPSGGSSSSPAPQESGDGALATASGSPSQVPKIVMGDKNFAEEYTLGALYSQALKAKGFKVTLKGNIGNSETINRALNSGKINMYPEYTGVIYTELAKLGDRPHSAEITFKGAKKWENGRGYSVLAPTPFQDKDCIAVLKPYAKEHGLTDISSMKKLKHWIYGGPNENKTRYQGVLGLQQAYHLHNFSFKALDIGLQYNALNDHKINGAACFTTDGQLASGKYQILPDTKGIFGFQQVTPVIKTSLLKKMPPQFTKTVNKVSSLLTSKSIIALNKATQLQHKSPAKVAKAFLKANDMLS